MKLCIGIDIGGTRTKIGLVDIAKGEVLTSRVKFTEKQSSRLFEEQLENELNHMIRYAGEQGNTVSGIGVGVTGFVWPDGTVDSTYGFITFMENYPLARWVQQRFKLSCKVDNDARTVALGESLFGHGRGKARMLMLTLGTGLGVGFIEGGKLSEPLPYGHMSGHLSIAQSTDLCYCGKNGCLESLVSASGLLAAAARTGIVGKEKSPDVEEIFAMAINGHTSAKTIVSQWLGYLKIGIDNYINLFAPDIIVLGGGVSKSLHSFIPYLEENKSLKPYKQYQVEIRISELAENAGILGSAALGVS